MDDHKIIRRVPRWVWAASAVVVLLWVAVAVCGYLLLPGGNEQAAITNAGQFGDFFGAVNALFSGFAFIGLIYTIHMQRQELELQRQELKAQREEMAGSREQLKAQAEAQLGSVIVAVAQIKVSGLQIVAEGIRLDADSTSDKVHKRNAALNIQEIGKTIQEQAAQLMAEIPTPKNSHR